MHKNPLPDRLTIVNQGEIVIQSTEVRLPKDRTGHFTKTLSNQDQIVVRVALNSRLVVAEVAWCPDILRTDNTQAVTHVSPPILTACCDVGLMLAQEHLTLFGSTPREDQFDAETLRQVGKYTS